MSDFQQFLMQIPHITRSLVIGSVGIKATSALHLTSDYQMMCYWPDVVSKLHIWRPLTAFLLPLSQPLQALMEIYMMYSYSKGLEESKFQNVTADYANYLLIVGSFIHSLTYLLSKLEAFQAITLSLFTPLTSALTYTWSRENPEANVVFYFLQIKAKYLPFVILFFRLVVEGQTNTAACLIGMLAAVFYQWLDLGGANPFTTAPQARASSGYRVYHRLNESSGTPVSTTTASARGSWIKTPDFLYKLLPWGSTYDNNYNSSRGQARSFGTAFKPASANSSTSGSKSRFGGTRANQSTSTSSGSSFGSSFRWGKGHKLGDK